MHAKKFLDGLFGSSLIHVAWFEIACWMPGRDRGVVGLELFDFVRLLVHARKVCVRRIGVNGGGRGRGRERQRVDLLRLAGARRYEPNIADWAQAPFAGGLRLDALRAFLAGVVLEPYFA